MNFIILTTGLLLTSASSHDLQTFQRMTSPTSGPVRLGPGWTAHTATSCYISCARMSPSCESFLYNSATGLCTPGAKVSASQPPPTQAEGALYQKFSPPPAPPACNTSAGFSLHGTQSSSACIGIFPSDLTYFDAILACDKMAAKAVTVPDLTKMELLKNMTYPRDFWIGCDDFDLDLVYVWTQTSVPIPDILMTSLLADGEQTKAYFNGNCCKFCPHNHTILVADCFDLNNFACEM